MTPLILINTNRWVCFFAPKGYQGYKKTIFTLLDEDRAATSGRILIEIVQGARNQGKKEMIIQYFQGVPWLPVHDAHWHRTADLALDLRRKGIAASAIDTLIPTVAIDYPCSFLHKDTDFDLISKHSALRSLPR